MGTDRSDAWLTALMVICAVLAAVGVAFEIHAARSDEPPPPAPVARVESSPVLATPANPLAESEPVSRVPKIEPAPAGPQDGDNPYVEVRRGAEVAIHRAPGGKVVAGAED